MGKTKIPILKEHGKTYVADRCQPVVQALEKGRIQMNALARAGYPGEALTRGELTGVLTVGYWNAKGIQDWGLATHCNEGIEVSCLETGQTAFQVDGKHFNLKPGALTITRPWQPHALGRPHIGSGRLHWLILDVGMRRPHQTWQWPDWFVLTSKDLARLTKLLRQNETPVWQAGPQILACFQQIATIITDKNTTFRISRLTLLINQLFIALSDMLGEQRLRLRPELTSTQRTVELFLDSLHQNTDLLAQPWTAQSMARQCEIGLTRFTQLCKTLTNMTPIQYLNAQRIETAVSLMQKHSQKSVTDIAFTCGFGSSQYFATVFKQIKGTTPSAWRRR